MGADVAASSKPRRAQTDAKRDKGRSSRCFKTVSISTSLTCSNGDKVRRGWAWVLAGAGMDTTYCAVPFACGRPCPWWVNGKKAMQNQGPMDRHSLRGTHRVNTALQRSLAWVLDQPIAAELRGQCCDRLRPAGIRQQMQQALSRRSLGGCTLVEWRWDLQQGRVEGWLWQNGLLRHFFWWRRNDRLVLRDQLQCSAMQRLHVLG